MRVSVAVDPDGGALGHPQIGSDISPQIDFNATLQQGFGSLLDLAAFSMPWRRTPTPMTGIRANRLAAGYNFNLLLRWLPSF